MKVMEVLMVHVVDVIEVHMEDVEKHMMQKQKIKKMLMVIQIWS